MSLLIYVKSLTHAINRLLGRRQKTIWQDGYDSPILLTADKAKKYIKHIYQNPSKANLVHSIDEYPGVSSWQMFKSNKHTKHCKKVNRDQIIALETPSLGVNEQKKILEQLQSLKLPNYEFILEPDAWRESFSNIPISSNEEIIAEIRKEEEAQRLQLLKSRKSVIGPTALRRESMTKEHSPKKYSKRMICLSSDISLRKAFIETYKFLSSLAKDAYLQWKHGNFSAQIPPGMFSPRRPDFASALSIY